MDKETVPFTICIYISNPFLVFCLRKIYGIRCLNKNISYKKCERAVWLFQKFNHNNLRPTLLIPSAVTKVNRNLSYNSKNPSDQKNRQFLVEYTC